MELILLLLRRMDGLGLAKWSFKLIGDLGSVVFRQ